MTDRLLNRNQVVEATSLSANTIYRLIRTGSFPAPITVEGTGIKRWKESAVQSWIDRQGGINGGIDQAA
jgi:predicted DNA-binding transcriptional regulator AlpA